MIREGIVCFRFRSEKQTDNVSFKSDKISAGELKSLIEEKRMRKGKHECFKRKTHYDFNLYDMATLKSKSHSPNKLQKIPFNKNNQKKFPTKTKCFLQTAR